MVFRSCEDQPKFSLMSFLCWQNVDFGTQYVTSRITHLHTQEEQFNLPSILGILRTHTKCTPYAENAVNKIWIANWCRCRYWLVMEGNYLVLTTRPSKMRKIVKECEEARHRKDEDRTFRKKLGASRNEQGNYSGWVYIKIYAKLFIAPTLAVVISAFTVPQRKLGLIPSLSSEP